MAVGYGHLFLRRAGGMGTAPDPGNALWREEHGQFITKHVGGKDAWVTSSFQLVFAALNLLGSSFISSAALLQSNCRGAKKAGSSADSCTSVNNSTWVSRLSLSSPLCSPTSNPLSTLSPGVSFKFFRWTMPHLYCRRLMR